MQTWTEKALEEGHLRLETVGKTEKIVCAAVGRAERWSDPEEKVRAEFYAELIYKYGYAPQRIGVEVTVPDRSPSDFADLVVFHDDERKKHLEGINFNKTDLDTKGVAFEQFLDGFFKGDFGQYFTPREIIQFCVKMLDPTADDRTLDPACGSGGFLLYAMDHVRRFQKENSRILTRRVIFGLFH